MMPSGSSAAGLGWPTSQVGWSSRAMDRLPASMRAAASLTSMRRWSRPRRWSVAPLVFLHRLGATARQARLDGVRGSDPVAAQKLKACPQALQTASDKRSPSLPLAGPSRHARRRVGWPRVTSTLVSAASYARRLAASGPTEPAQPSKHPTGSAEQTVQVHRHQQQGRTSTRPARGAIGLPSRSTSRRSTRTRWAAWASVRAVEVAAGEGVHLARLNARLSPPWGLAPAPHGRHHPAGPGPRPGHAGRP
jgi:hypothetical protein